MLTTNDIELKEVKPKKLNIISTNTVGRKEFNEKKAKKAKPSGPIITTSNVERFLAKLKIKKKGGKKGKKK